MGALTKKIGEPDDHQEHCEDHILDLDAPKCLRWFLLVNRLPAIEKWLAEEMAGVPKLFATHEGKRVRVVMASRLGDVGITKDLDAENGYDKRVMISSLSDFSDTPDA